MTDYHDFLDRRRHSKVGHGFESSWLPDFLFDFQRELVEWALQEGRAAIFADCGLGKTPMQLVWSENVARHAGNVLVLTPLAVSAQTIREAEKFGIQATRSTDGTPHRITVTNYERLRHFDPSDFAGCVCDESSILKSFDGVRRGEITAFMRKIPYRLLCTATAAPNDYTELGTSSEALGHLGHMDMLGRFFKNDLGNAATQRAWGGTRQWRFKGHAEIPFWKWVCSWARAIRRPSDLGFDDRAFTLPDLIERQHVVKSNTLPDGMLFAMPATDLHSQRAERRRTIQERCKKVAELVTHDEPALVWCHLNDEGNLLSKMIPGSVQVSGSDADDQKEARFLGFADGTHRVLITKPTIGAWGLNFQQCAHVTFFPSHSFEQFYQGVRRCWRFGQTRDVTVDIVTTEGERDVLANLQRKASAADDMFSRLVELMNQSIQVHREDRFELTTEVPSWL